MSPEKEIRDRLERIPYARMLGVEPDFDAVGFCLRLPFRTSNIGNPILPALHGGAIGGFMELCAIVQVMLDMNREGQPKPIGISVDYLRSGKSEDTQARAIVQRLGSRVANVRVTAWQSDADKPIATLHGNFLLPPKD